MTDDSLKGVEAAARKLLAMKPRGMCRPVNEQFLEMTQEVITGHMDGEWFFGMIQQAVDIGIVAHQIPLAVVAWGWQATDFGDVEGTEDEEEWRLWEHWRHPKETELDATSDKAVDMIAKAERSSRGTKGEKSRKSQRLSI